MASNTAVNSEIILKIINIGIESRHPLYDQEESITVIMITIIQKWNILRNDDIKLLEVAHMDVWKLCQKLEPCRRDIMDVLRAAAGTDGCDRSYTYWAVKAYVDNFHKTFIPEVQKYLEGMYADQARILKEQNRMIASLNPLIEEEDTDSKATVIADVVRHLEWEEELDERARLRRERIERERLARRRERRERKLAFRDGVVEYNYW